MYFLKGFAGVDILATGIWAGEFVLVSGPKDRFNNSSKTGAKAERRGSGGGVSNTFPLANEDPKAAGVTLRVFRLLLRSGRFASIPALAELLVFLVKTGGVCEADEVLATWIGKCAGAGVGALRRGFSFALGGGPNDRLTAFRSYSY